MPRPEQERGGFSGRYSSRLGIEQAAGQADRAALMEQPFNAPLSLKHHGSYNATTPTLKRNLNWGKVRQAVIHLYIGRLKQLKGKIDNVHLLFPFP